MMAYSLVQLWQLQWSNRAISLVKNIALLSQADDIHLKNFYYCHIHWALDGYTFSTVSMTKDAVLITDHGLIIMSVT